MLKSHNWTVVDTDSGNWKYVRATSQKEAWTRAARKGYVAKKTDHVRPKGGDAELMERKEFNEWVSQQL